jgi:hypothetical protein
VAARRLILAMLVLLVLSSVAAALIPPDRQVRETSSSTTQTTTPEPEGKLIKRTVSASADRRPTIQMHVGDQLQLKVTSPVPNMVEIEEFGELEDTDPNFPASFDLLPFDSGRFAVRLVDPAGLVATIHVKP